MNTTAHGMGFLETFALSLSTLFTTLLEQAFGPGVHEPFYRNITRADVGAMVCLMLLVVLVNGLAVSFLRRRIRQAAGDAESREWRARLWQTIGRPCYLIIWVIGISVAATPILQRLPTTGELHPVRVLLDTLLNGGVFVALFWLFFKFTHVLESFLKAWAGKTKSKLDDLVVPLLGRSLRVIIPVVGAMFALPMIGLSPESAAVLEKGSSILIIGAVAYILFQAVALAENAVMSQYDINAADNLQARTVYTQVHVLSKTLFVIIGIFTVASVLMLFDEVRRFGTSILASAGVLGVIIGFAAQRTIANLFAGFQIAMTQPIRLDDVVIVEGEWGRIEEISLTYVVVHIWDDRRLIVPLSHFIEKPFQNWTRKSADILGSVFVWVDFTMPIAELRPAIEQIVRQCGDWDKRFWNLQVTDTTDRAMQLRVLATSADASKAWSLRCEIREKLIAYLQERHPQGLPRLRAAVDSVPSPTRS